MRTVFRLQARAIEVCLAEAVVLAGTLITCARLDIVAHCQLAAVMSSEEFFHSISGRSMSIPI